MTGLARVLWQIDHDWNRRKGCSKHWMLQRPDVLFKVQRPKSKPDRGNNSSSRFGQVANLDAPGELALGQQRRAGRHGCRGLGAD